MAFIIHYLAILAVSVSFNLKKEKIPFNISKPEIKIEISKELKEISGLTWYDNQLAAVQDEAGIIYLLNANTGEINEKIRFSLPGDFEGIEVIGDCFYTLTSSGTLFAIDKNNSQQLIRIDTPLSWQNDTEGLAYNAKKNQLLIACKGLGSIPGHETKGKAIYGLSPEDHQLTDKPVIVIKKKALKEFIDVDKFKPSALAVDPITQDLYVLASVGKLLVVLSPEYEIKSVTNLSNKIYPQPEGICFSPKGDLYISNEGNNGRANFYHLLRHQ
jgi:uncharacterized protein YjiK